MASGDMAMAMAEDLPQVEESLMDALAAYVDVHDPFVRNTIDWLVGLGVATSADDIIELVGGADAPDDLVNLALAAVAPVEELLKTVNADGLNCPICMDDDEEAEWKETPCGHRFHGRCVETWLRAKGSCPMCRHQVMIMPAAAAAAAASTSTAVFSNLELEEFTVEDAIMEFMREGASYRTPL